MSERQDREEDLRRREAEERRAPNMRIDAEGHAREERQGENLREESGPRPVGGRQAGSRSEQRSEGDGERGTSWAGVIFGWLAALGASLILSGIVGAVVGAIFGGAGSSGSTEGGVTGLIGLLITLLLAFLIGGYVAGRLASRSGVKHGLLVPLVALIVTILLALIGTLIGANFIQNLSGVTLPGLPNDAPQNLGAILTGAGILALLFPFIGGAIGGAWGAKTGRRRP